MVLPVQWLRKLLAFFFFLKESGLLSLFLSLKKKKVEECLVTSSCSAE